MERRTKARKEAIDELIVAFQLVCADLADEDDLIRSMTNIEMGELLEVSEAIKEAVENERSRRKGPGIHG